MLLRLPTPQDVAEASRRLADVVVHTPILRSNRLDALLNGRAFVKFESLQHTGAFKFRGAYNCLSRLDRRAFPDGVIAYSTGNHGQAVATVGRMLGIKALIVMPDDAPGVKIALARDQGAEIILYDRLRETREAIAEKLIIERRSAIVPPGDDPHVIAGQGTVTSEALVQLGSVDVEIVCTPCGGGGLAAGTALALTQGNSGAQIWAAEPANFDDTRRSLASGSRQQNPALSGSICDALLARTPAELPFEINRHRLANVLVATDEQVLDAMRFAFEEFKIVVEPGGAVALAALLASPGILDGRAALIIASGGNVDTETLMRAVDSRSSTLRTAQPRQSSWVA